MTTRSISTGSLYGPAYFVDTVNGSDGKYTLDANGNKIIQWNNYERDHIDQQSVGSTYPPPYGPYYIAGDPGANLISRYKPASVATLQNKLVSKIRNHDFNLGVAIAEGRQTVNLVVDNLKSISLAAHDLRKGDFSSALRRLGTQFDVNASFVNPGRARSALRLPSSWKNSAAKALTTKDIANRWIEIQYGWKPLLSDVFEASNAYAALSSPERREQVRVRIREDTTINTSQSPTLYGVPTNVSVKQYLTAELKEELSAPRSLGLTDPLSIAWEILPWSFVIDWFLPIGSFLENLNVIPKLRGRSMYTIIWNTQGYGKYTGDSPYYKGSSTRFSSYYIKRTVTASGVPLAFPNFKPLDKALSPTHLYNAIALARQQFT